MTETVPSPTLATRFETKISPFPESYATALGNCPTVIVADGSIFVIAQIGDEQKIIITKI
jgi:hypothetical protein